MKTAVCQVGHPGSLDSLAMMLRAVDYKVKVPGDRLMDALKHVGCDTIVSAANMAGGWNGRLLTAPHEEATVADMLSRETVYVDTKAHRNGPKVVSRWPSLSGRVLWYRINGARPCHVPGKGDELNPGCPVLTPDPWYSELGRGYVPDATLARSYSMWPPYARWDEHQRPRQRSFAPPVCLTHALDGWGYGDVGRLLAKSVGLKRYGGYGSPDGIYPMKDVPMLLSSAVCLLHLKSQDCPGYSLYEALASACPVVVSRMLIDWCMMHSLFEEGVTCLCYDRGVADGGAKDGQCLPIDAKECAREAAERVAELRDPATNRRIGEAGRERLRQLMWSRDARSSTESLTEFMSREFP